MNPDEIEIIEQYLDSLGSTLWGRSFAINSPSGRHEATMFIYDLWSSLEEVLYQRSIERAENDG